MGDATDMEHDIQAGSGEGATVREEEGPGEGATVREEEGPGEDAIDTEEEPGRDTKEPGGVITRLGDTKVTYLTLWTPISVPKT